MSKSSKISASPQKSVNQVKIDFIVACLKNGEQRGKVLVKVGKKWGTSKSAFDRLLKIAKQQHAAEQQAIKKHLDELEVQAAIEARKKDILTADERKELLTKIAKGEIEIPTKDAKWDQATKKFVMLSFIELPSHTARISAIAELNKMEGSYAAEKHKHEIGGINGAPIQTSTVTLTKEELLQYSKTLEKDV
jgi:hypothetical protein